jgi:hypothetical protein
MIEAIFIQARLDKMDLTRAIEQSAAMTIGIVDVLDRRFDPLDRPFGEGERAGGLCVGSEFGQRVEHGRDALRPGRRRTIFNIAAGARRLVDRLAQARLQRSAVGFCGRRSQLQPAQQIAVLLRQLQDQLDQGVDALVLQVSPYPREHGDTLAPILARGVDRQRDGDHVLAETRFRESRTIAFAAERLPAPRDRRAVVFRARDLRQHALGFEDKDFHPAVAMIGLAARERLRPRALAQGVEIEARAFRRTHIGGCSNPSFSIRRRASSSVTEGNNRNHCPVCLRHMTSNRISAKHSSRWSRRVKAESNSSPAFSAKPER